MCDEVKDKLRAMSPQELATVASQLGISEGELAGGLKGTCGGCPFNDGMTEEASQAQNYGCLPTQGGILQMKRESGHNWACHSDESKMCAGLCHSAKAEGLDLKQGGLIRYSTWYHQGQEAALAEAAST